MPDRLPAKSCTKMNTHKHIHTLKHRKVRDVQKVRILDHVFPLFFSPSLKYWIIKISGVVKVAYLQVYQNIKQLLYDVII